jgi:hypothetical protein
MNRRKFMKSLGMATAGAFAAPYILPSGRLFAATGSRVANHVVLCLYAGGVRNMESIDKAEGNLMPNILRGTESISSDILPGLDNVPAPVLSTPLQDQGTLFKGFRYANNSPGHYQGHFTAITGRYVGYDINFNQPAAYPTLFEYYRKHNSPQNSANNAWWVSNNIGENQHLSFSMNPDYGPDYGANFFSPVNILTAGNYAPIDLCRNFSTLERQKMSTMRDCLNQSVVEPILPQAPMVKNTVQDQHAIQAFLSNLATRQKNNQLWDPWSIGTGMNSDMFNMFFAEEIIKNFSPELLVVNMTGVDAGHSDFTEYCNNLRKADYAVGHLWNTIQSTPGMANDTVMIVVPEIGRNLQHNSIVDAYGRYGLDHSDNMSKEIFCMVAGASGKVVLKKVISSVTGESIDVVPTIAHILGFYQDIPQGYLPGGPLYQAFTN